MYKKTLQYPSELSFINMKPPVPVGRRIELLSFSRTKQNGGYATREKHGHPT
jgi:hypothetical protein